MSKFEHASPTLTTGTSDMKNITVIIDRVSRSNIQTAKAEIDPLLEGGERCG